MRGKKGTAQARPPKGRRRPPDVKPRPLRAIAVVPDREVFDALTTQSTLSAAAFVLSVNLEELTEHLGSPEVGKRLRAARIASGEQADTRVVASAPMAVAELVTLAREGTQFDGARVFASRAILDYAARVLKADRTAPGSKKLAWGEAPPPFEPSIEDDIPETPTGGPGELASLPAKGTA